MRISTSFQKSAFVFGWIVVGFIFFHVMLLFITVDLSQVFHRSIDSATFFIEFAPEIWLTLLSIILGTLIIVISIASQSNPKLIDYYLGDYPSLFYIWGIILAGTENIILQLELSVHSIYWNNVIFVNAYLVLPGALLSAIPYTFYILSYTKTSNVIHKITAEHKKYINFALKKGHLANEVRHIQYSLLDTINQLDDQLGFVQFKEPKSDIINQLSDSVKIYLSVKSKIDPQFFLISTSIEKDISFKTLGDKIEPIEQNQTFYEYKVLRIFGGIYQGLIIRGLHDIASQCANELVQIGLAAKKYNHYKVVDAVLIQLNTFLRFGINHAVQVKDIRSVYNCIFHYSNLLDHFIQDSNREYILRCCKYQAYYAMEIYDRKKEHTHFTFLIDAFVKELQEVLISIHKQGFEKEFQLKILEIFAQIDVDVDEKENPLRKRRKGTRIIKLCLILYYLKVDEDDLANYLLHDIILQLRQLSSLSKNEIVQTIVNDCKMIKESLPTFWEDTDRGNHNIYYSPNKKEITGLIRLFHKEMAGLSEKRDITENRLIEEEA